MLRQLSSEPNDRKNSSVLSRRLNVTNDGGDVTDGGSEFHTRAAATGKARSPIVSSDALYVEWQEPSSTQIEAGDAIPHPPLVEILLPSMMDLCRVGTGRPERLTEMKCAPALAANADHELAA